MKICGYCHCKIQSWETSKKVGEYWFHFSEDDPMLNCLFDEIDEDNTETKLDPLEEIED